MAFTIILICLVVQRLLQFDSQPFQKDWFALYYKKWQPRLLKSTDLNRWLALSLIILPIFIVFILFIAIVYHLLGSVFYYLINLLIFWYFLDSRRLTCEADLHLKISDILMQKCTALFSLLFWYLLFGLYGAFLYVCLHQLLAWLRQEDNAELVHICTSAQMLIQWLDWLPARLMSATFALVGHFTQVIRVWLQQVFSGPEQTQQLVAHCGLVALGLPSEEQERQVCAEDIVSLNKLIDYALIVWLTVIALFTIGMWLG